MNRPSDVMEKFEELHNFLVSYFGDYWEGKTEADIVAEAAKDSSEGYLDTISEQICDFIGLDLPLKTKHAFVKDAGIQLAPGAVIDWLANLKESIESYA